MMTGRHIRRMAIMAGLSGAALSPVQAQNDPLAPRDNAATAVVSTLAAATIGTADLTVAERFYGQVMGMACARRSFAGAAAQAFRRHYGLRRGGTVAALECRRGEPMATVIRIVDVGSAPLARPEYDARITGALSLGFPSVDNVKLEARARAAGFASTAGQTAITLKRADGSDYRVSEVHLKAPDGVLALGIDRGAMPAVGAIDVAAGTGGPAYSGMMVGDVAAARRVFSDVLGLEMRRGTLLTSAGPGGGLGLPSGARFDFQQWYTPGAATGYIILMQLRDAARPAPGPLGLRRRGLGMWTFETQKLDAVLKRARAAGVRIVAPPTPSPWGGSAGRSAILATADGFPVELVEAPPRTAIASPAAPLPPPDPDVCDNRPVIMVVSGLLKDRARLAAYAKAIRDSGLYDRLGGYYMNNPRAIATFEGAVPANASTLMVRFPCFAHARAFWYSTQYQRDIIPLRTNPSAGDFTVTVYPEIAPPPHMAGRLQPGGYSWQPGPEVRAAIPMVDPPR